MSTNIRNMTADAAYAVRLAELQAVLSSVDDCLADASAPMHGSRHWGHVGDLSRALDLAQQLRDAMGCKVSA